MNEKISIRSIKKQQQAKWFRKCHEKEIERQNHRMKERHEYAFQCHIRRNYR